MSHQVNIMTHPNPLSHIHHPYAVVLVPTCIYFSMFTIGNFKDVFDLLATATSFHSLYKELNEMQECECV